MLRQIIPYNNMVLSMLCQAIDFPSSSRSKVLGILPILVAVQQPITFTKDSALPKLQQIKQLTTSNDSVLTSSSQSLLRVQVAVVCSQIIDWSNPTKSTTNICISSRAIGTCLNSATTLRNTSMKNREASRQSITFKTLGSVYQT